MVHAQRRLFREPPPVLGRQGLQRTLVKTVSLARLADGCLAFLIHAVDIIVDAAAIAFIAFHAGFFAFFAFFHRNLLSRTSGNQTRRFPHARSIPAGYHTKGQKAENTKTE
jgi:hypothetical protein